MRRIVVDHDVDRCLAMYRALYRHSTYAQQEQLITAITTLTSRQQDAYYLSVQALRAAQPWVEAPGVDYEDDPCAPCP